jgi:hypothetical protein
MLTETKHLEFTYIAEGLIYRAQQTIVIDDIEFVLCQYVQLHHAFDFHTCGLRTTTVYV